MRLRESRSRSEDAATIATQVDANSLNTLNGSR